MPFPTKLLNDGEELVLDLRPHWIRLVLPTLAVVVLIVATGAVVGLAPGPQWLAFIPLALLVLAVLNLLRRYATWTTTNFVVTTDRLVARSGVVAKKGMEIPLERVQNIAFNQSIFERMVGAGDLMIESGGEDGQNRFTDIRKPSLVQNEIYRQIEANGNKTADRMAGRRELSVVEQLEKLDELRGRGVLSQAEFDAKKADLLSRM